MSICRPLSSPRTTPRRLSSYAGTRTSARRPIDATEGRARFGDTRTVATLRKNNIEAIHVRVTGVGGTSLVDVRVFTPDGRAGGEPVPTKNGVCIPRRQLRALIDALTAAEVA